MPAATFSYPLSPLGAHLAPPSCVVSSRPPSLRSSLSLSSILSPHLLYIRFLPFDPFLPTPSPRSSLLRRSSRRNAYCAKTMADDHDRSTSERDLGMDDDLTEPLLDSFSVDSLLRRLGANGADATMVEQLSSLLKSCNLSTIGALRRFSSLSELTAEMFDTTTSLGRLKAQGLLAAIHVSAECSPFFLLSRDALMFMLLSLRMRSASHKYPWPVAQLLGGVAPHSLVAVAQPHWHQTRSWSFPEPSRSLRTAFRVCHLIS